jgi:HlyD family secretion protein
MKVVDPKTMQVEGSINQAESSHFRIGQPAIVKLDAFPDAVYQGKVYSIGALATGNRGQQYFIRNVPIRIQVTNPDSRMIPDLSASADVLIDKAENALLVPVSAILAEGGKHYVEIRTPKGFEKREVTTGISNGTQIVIVSGVNEGDEIKVN